MVTANAAMDVTVSDVPVAAAPAPAPTPAPVVSASDFSGVNVTPSVVGGHPSVVIPEPGTMFAGFGLLTYLLFRTGRRSRA